MWVCGGRIYRNHMLYREAICLQANRDVWYADGSTEEAAAKLPAYNVGTRIGNLILVNEDVTIDGRTELAELGWTNSCLGHGVIIVTSSNSFLWRTPTGVIRKLKTPDLHQVPFWWWLTNP